MCSRPHRLKIVRTDTDPSMVVGIGFIDEFVRAHMDEEVGAEQGVLQLNGRYAVPLRKVQQRLINSPGDAIPFYFHAMCRAPPLRVREAA